MKNITYDDYIKLFRSQHSQTEPLPPTPPPHGPPHDHEYIPVEIHLPKMPSINIWQRLRRGLYRLLYGVYDTTFALVSIVLLFCVLSLVLYYSMEMAIDVACGYAHVFNSTLCLPSAPNVTRNPNITTTTTTTTAIPTTTTSSWTTVLPIANGTA